MKTKRVAGVLIGSVLSVWAGCEKTAPPQLDKPREAPVFEKTAATDDSPTATRPAAGADALPPDHPPINSARRSTAATPPAEGAAGMPLFTPPPGWESRPARTMVAQVYSLAKVEGDAENAEVTISTLGTVIPLQMNIDRWCKQFGLVEADACAQAAKKRPLEGTAHPTTLVELSGTFHDTMRTGPAKPGSRMIAAEIIANNRPWYVKLVGPEKTVSKWEPSFIQFVKDAK